MTSNTPTPPSAAHQLNCLTFGIPVFYHTSSSTSATCHMRHKLRHYRLASTSHSGPPCMFMDILQCYFLTQAFPPDTSRRICNLHNLDSGYIFSLPFTIQHFLWCLWQPLLQAVPVDTLEDRMQNAVGQVDPPRRDPNSPMPYNVTLSKPHNKEKLYRKYLETQCSDRLRKHLEIVLSNPPGRVRTYVHWHLHNKHKRGLYKPAPYLTHQSSPYQLERLRIRTQQTIHIIPSHLHYVFRNPRADYQDRVCLYCLASCTRFLGDELHIISSCPTTKVILDRFTDKFQRLTRLLDLPSFTTFSAEETKRLVLGNPPAKVLQQDLRRWIQEATPLCREYAYALPTHIT